MFDNSWIKNLFNTKEVNASKKREKESTKQKEKIMSNKESQEILEKSRPDKENKKGVITIGRELRKLWQKSC